MVKGANNDSTPAWWRHQMETFSALLAICAGNSPVPVNSPHKGRWRGALMFSLICVCINGWINNREAGDLRRHRGHYDVNVMTTYTPKQSYRLWWGAADQCTMSHGTYIHIMIWGILNYTIKMYIWNQTGKNSIISSKQILVCMSLRKSLF